MTFSKLAFLPWARAVSSVPFTTTSHSNRAHLSQSESGEGSGRLLSSHLLGSKISFNLKWPFKDLLIRPPTRKAVYMALCVHSPGKDPLRTETNQENNMFTHPISCWLHCKSWFSRMAGRLAITVGTNGIHLSQTSIWCNSTITPASSIYHGKAFASNVLWGFVCVCLFFCY